MRVIRIDIKIFLGNNNSNPFQNKGFKSANSSAEPSFSLNNSQTNNDIFGMSKGSDNNILLQNKTTSQAANGPFGLSNTSNSNAFSNPQPFSASPFSQPNVTKPTTTSTTS